MANYIIALAHFCELHGPVSIICTQQTHENVDQTSYLLPGNSKVQTCASCKLILPQEAINLITSDSNNANGPRPVCISSKYPSSQRRYTALTKVVMKSLTVEASADPRRPIMYGDSVDGYCVSRVFKVRDPSARGGERKYSFIVLCDSESHLSMNWEIVALYIGEMISHIQQMVEVRGSGRATEEIDNEKYLRRSMVRPKLLVELTGDDQIFVRLHMWARELLHDVADSPDVAQN